MRLFAWLTLLPFALLAWAFVLMLLHLALAAR